eukprot:TRINITY_DN12441_c0_g1_i6.p1 TRINITY_DN12441_c0_g1~~TRINITY_DN12441_c0_g1_i6.p1  ORF type:complete len:422 (+),score=124.27 TRINITY_DN12441_c0_g1_i6:120-1385(+)
MYWCDNKYMELQYAYNRYKAFSNPYQTPEREPRNQDGDTEDYKIADPALYVTKVIAPENEVKKRLMARELSEALDRQIREKEQRKAEERKRRIEDELREEARLKKQLKPAEKRTGRAKVQANLESRPKASPEPLKQSPSTNKSLKSSPSQVKWEDTSVMKVGNENYNVDIMDREGSVPIEIEYNMVDYSNELNRLQSELYMKNQEFNKLLDNLKEHSTRIANTRDQAERDLNEIKRLITNKITPIEQLITKRREETNGRRMGMSRYSPLYLNNYNDILNRGRGDESRGYSRSSSRVSSRESNSIGMMRSGGEVLHGESHMIMWNQRNPVMQNSRREISSFKRIRPLELPKSSGIQYRSYMLKPRQAESSIEKSKYEKLDDIIKELLEDVPIEVKNEPSQDEAQPSDDDLSLIHISEPTRPY